MQQASQNFLARGTRGRYHHAPVLSFAERTKFLSAMLPMQQQPQVLVKPMTQTQVVARMRKNGWLVADFLYNDKHPGTSCKLMQHAEHRATAVVYPDGRVDRVNAISEVVNLMLRATGAGWYSPIANEAARNRANDQLPVGVRRTPKPFDVKAVRTALMGVFKPTR